MIHSHLTLTSRLVLAGLLTFSTLTAHALGFGAPKVLSEIGQPFKAEIELNLSSGETTEEVIVSQAGPVMYERLSVNYSTVHSAMNVVVGKRAGKPYALITTSASMVEPSFSFILYSQSNQGRMYRLFSLPVNTSAVKMTSLEKMTPAIGQPNQAASDISPLVPVNGGVYLNIIELGARPALGAHHKIKEGQKGVPAMKALRAVVPKQWKAYAGDKDIDANVLVSFEGGSRTWLEVLDQVMQQSAMSATVDWEKKEITFRSSATRTSVYTSQAGKGNESVPEKSAQVEVPASTTATSSGGAPIARAKQIAQIVEERKALTNVEFTSGELTEFADVKTAGVEARFYDAAMRIVPNGWTASPAPGVQIDQSVSWRGQGRDWVVVMSEVAQSVGFKVLIDSQKRTVTLSK